MTTSRLILLSGAIFLSVAVVLGAFGAHGLKSKISPEMLEVYQTGVQYHFYHALGLLLIGVLSQQMSSGLLGWAALFLTLGIFLFSGSLYVLAISGIKWLGAITPLGGVSFIAGWILLAIAVWKN